MKITYTFTIHKDVEVKELKNNYDKYDICDYCPGLEEDDLSGANVTVAEVEFDDGTFMYCEY